VNDSGNGISWITRTQGKKGARSILEKDQSEGSNRSPRPIGLGRPAWHPLMAPGAPLHLVSVFMHMLIRVLEFGAHKFQKQTRFI
jgi:hypothetical protein